MTRTEAKELQEAFNHFANGGDLWWCDTEEPLSPNSWKKQTIFGCNDECKIMNIIEDKHFELRKAYALGEKIECRRMTDAAQNVWKPCIPKWQEHLEYRIKPKEVYEWQWILLADGFISDKTLDYHTKYVNGWTKFEPSKRIRKDK